MYSPVIISMLLLLSLQNNKASSLKGEGTCSKTRSLSLVNTENIFHVEFSLARYSSTAVYANNSVVDMNLVGEGFEDPQITDGGALECHTDDTTCCRGHR